MNISKGDALDFLKSDVVYDFLFLSPADFNQIYYNDEIFLPDNPEAYQQFLDELVSEAKPRKNFICTQVTDRMYNGIILPRSTMMINAMAKHGWSIHTHKIWARHLKTDMFRMSYSHIITFCKGKYSAKQSKRFRPHVWVIPQPKSKIAHYHGECPVELVERLLETYTVEGDIVCDPFCGSGTVGEVAKNMGRDYELCEYDEEIYNVAVERLSSKTLFDLV